MAQGDRNAGGWLQGIGLGFAERIAEFSIYALAALLIFPLLPIFALLVAIACIATLMLRLRRRQRKWRIVAIGFTTVLGLSLLNVVAIASGSDTKYVVIHPDVTDSLFVRQFEGPTGRFTLVPLSSYSAPKRWLFRAAAERFERVVIMEEPEETATGFILHSPSELALARLSAPDGTRRERTLHLPTRRWELLFEIEDGQVSFKPGLDGRRIMLLTNVGPGRPGLFGRSLSRSPSLEQWRRVAYAEELLRNLATMEADEIIRSLEEESARTSDVRDYLRLAVFRLELISVRYGGILTLHKPTLFELAPLGNLRRVAAQLTEINPSRDDLADPWIRPLQKAVLSSLSNLPPQTVAPPGWQVESGADWAVAFLRASTGEAGQYSSAPQQGKQPSDQTEEEAQAKGALAAFVRKGTEAKDETDLSAALEDFARDLQASTAKEDPLGLGDMRRMEELDKAGGSLLRREVRRWVESNPSRADSRAFLVYEAAHERCGQPFERMWARTTTPAKMRALSVETKRACAEVAAAARLAPEVLQRRFLESEAAAYETLVSAAMDSQVELLECGARAGEDESKSLQCFGDAMRYLGLPFFEEFMRDMTKCREGSCGVLAFEKRLPVPGRPYSLAEYRYASYLTLALFDEHYPRLSEVVCDSVGRDFGELLEEDQLLDRLTILNLHMAALERCGAEDAGISLRLLRENRLPLARWHRWVLDGPAYPPVGSGGSVGATKI